MWMASSTVIGHIQRNNDTNPTRMHVKKRCCLFLGGGGWGGGKTQTNLQAKKETKQTKNESRQVSHR